ncbi:MAG: DUF4412 domain-containing protein [Verrucomicrobiota bacterium]
MKKILFTAQIGMACLSLISAHAQFGAGGGNPGMGAPQGPKFDGTMAQFFGEHTAFSASLQMEIKAADKAEPLRMPGKLDFDQGKTRWEMDMAEMKTAQVTPETAAMLKNMGLSRISLITLPGKKTTLMVYPDKKAYVEMPMESGKSQAAAKPEDYKTETTELGKDTVDGHPCVKNKMVVTDKEGKKQEATVWNATDLKKFPVKIQYAEEQGNAITMSFKNVNAAKPAANRFDAPIGFTKYNSIMELMMSSMGGMLPGQ